MADEPEAAPAAKKVPVRRSKRPKKEIGVVAPAVGGLEQGPAELTDAGATLENAVDALLPADDGQWVQEVESSYLQSKYTLVSVAAKRARELLNGKKRRVDSLSEKPVTVALEELAQGKLYFERTREGIK